MLNRIVLAAALVVLLALASAACARLKTDIETETVTDVDSLVDYLRENHVALLDHGPFISPSMSVLGYKYTPTSGGALHVFKYPTDGDALSDVALFNNEGDPRRAPPARFGRN